MSRHRYAGRDIALATLHGKQRILARPLRHGLGLTLHHAASVNTDQLGSFDGEQARSGDALSICRQKAELALEALGLDLGIASEGSFGPHPAVPLLPVNQEWITFVDRRDGVVISEQLLSLSTNVSSCTGRDLEGVAGWLKQVGFPRHGVMVRAHSPDLAPGVPWLAKGIHAPSDLDAWMQRAVRQSSHGLAWLETDMRAHCNPTRRTVIRQLAFRLVRRVAWACPTCETPGWGLLDTVPGLPCQACGLATDLVQLEIHGCQSCGARQHQPRRDRRQWADPSHCPYCNP